MNCPYCSHPDSKVTDSRESSESIRRRRECLLCGRRFTTYERVQAGLLVIKKDGRREEFQREKLVTGVRKACTKRPVSEETIEKMADEIEAELQEMGKLEVASSTIGEMVMERLKEIDRVAYIRFASVYRQFADIETFKEEVEALTQKGELSRYPDNQLPLIPKEGANAIGMKKLSSKDDRTKALRSNDRIGRANHRGGKNEEDAESTRHRRN